MKIRFLNQEIKNKKNMILMLRAFKGLKDKLFKLSRQSIYRKYKD